MNRTILHLYFVYILITQEIFYLPYSFSLSLLFLLKLTAKFFQNRKFSICNVYHILVKSVANFPKNFSLTNTIYESTKGAG